MQIYIFFCYLYIYCYYWKSSGHITNSNFIPALQGSFYLSPFLHSWLPTPSVRKLPCFFFSIFTYFHNTPLLICNKSPDPATLQASGFQGYRCGWKVWGRVPAKSNLCSTKYMNNSGYEQPHPRHKSTSWHTPNSDHVGGWGPLS